MKTNNQKYLVRATHYLLLILFWTSMLNCSKKNETPPDPFITTQPGKITSTNLNSCAMAGAKVGTKFFYTIPYNASSAIVIATVEYSAKSTDGTKSSGQFSAGSDGTDGNFETSSCVRFDSNPWVEWTFTLVSSTGLKSNPSVLRMDKPAGAN